MTSPFRRLAPYAYALAGVALISVLIGLVRSRYAVPDLSLVLFTTQLRPVRELPDNVAETA